MTSENHLGVNHEPFGMGPCSIDDTREEEVAEAATELKKTFAR